MDSHQNLRWLVYTIKIFFRPISTLNIDSCNVFRTADILPRKGQLVDIVKNSFDSINSLVQMKTQINYLNLGLFLMVDFSKNINCSPNQFSEPGILISFIRMPKHLHKLRPPLSSCLFFLLAGAWTFCFFWVPSKWQVLLTGSHDCLQSPCLHVTFIQTFNIVMTRISNTFDSFLLKRS